MNQDNKIDQDGGVSESRFYMWRAVFAVAHVDGQVAADEEDFMEKYLINVPFSRAQREQLVRDMSNPQEVGEMLSRVTSPADQSEFFYFARMLAFSDGVYDSEEERTLETYLDKQLSKFELGHLQTHMEGFRDRARIRRELEEQMWENQAEDKLGLGAMIKKMLTR